MPAPSSPPGPGDDPTGSLVEASGAARLVVVGGQAGLCTFALPARGVVELGRDPACAIAVAEPTLSRRHARLELGPPLRVTDLGSRHGTIVRGLRLPPDVATELALDEVLTLGALTVLVQRPAASPRPIWGPGYLELRLTEACAAASRGGPAVGLVRVQADERLALAALAELDERAVVARVGVNTWDVLMVGGALDGVTRRLSAVPGALVASARTPDDGQDGPALATAVAGRAAPRPRASGLATIGPMAAVRALVEKIAAGDISVLVVGETGVGKEVVAEHLHRSSPRASRPLVRLNCAALAEALLESELFGHEKGAFTGAGAAKPGLLEQADGGTVLLDEIGELPPATQVKLLRVIEQRELLRVGGLRPRPIDVRFVAATHRDLEAAVATGGFREDLYFRIAGVVVRVPPLRQRPDELLGLAVTFAERVARTLGRPTPRLADDARAWLRDHPWPGNVRELRNVIERATLLCDDVIERRHLPEERGASPAAVGLEQVRARHDELERQAIADALARTDGDQARAALLLGVSRRTLTNKLNRHGLPRPRKR